MYPFLKQAFFKISLALCCIIASIVSLNAQQSIFSFSPLGSKIYTEKIKQLEKYVVPKNYSDKSSQAWYEEILTGRNKAILSAFKDDDILYDTFLLNKCNSVLKRISQANPTFKFDTIKLYINRSIVANAACYGEGTIMVNLGLFLWLDNDDELALVVAHEISHQLLNHSDQKMQKSIATLTSDEFKEELKNIKKADYGKFDRFRKLMKGLTIEAGKHSTYKESEADSLPVILAKNANYNISYAAKVLLKLDHVDDLFTSDKLYTLKDVINNAPIDFSFLIQKQNTKVYHL
ncbi:MAG: M48 family metalloprotease [Chitinophagaceae bacterium]|nr:M48 family metalloprotease [Chitinophagaceae bacterium]